MYKKWSVGPTRMFILSYRVIKLKLEITTGTGRVSNIIIRFVFGLTNNSIIFASTLKGLLKPLIYSR